MNGEQAFPIESVDVELGRRILEFVSAWMLVAVMFAGTVAAIFCLAGVWQAMCEQRQRILVREHLRRLAQRESVPMTRKETIPQTKRCDSAALSVDRREKPV